MKKKETNKELATDDSVNALKVSSSSYDESSGLKKSSEYRFFKKGAKNKKILIVGLGKTGISLSRFLISIGAKVTISDHKSPPELISYLEEIQDLDVQLDLGQHSFKLFLDQDLIILSPGVSPDLKVIKYAEGQNVPITGELEFISSYIKEPIIAVTGTNGKTTTVKLIYDFLKESGLKVWAGGNYGEPISEYPLKKQKFDLLVVEVSSFQLQYCKHFNPDTIIFSNLSPHHLERHKTFEEYAKVKKNIFLNNDLHTRCVLNADDENVIEIARDPIVYQRSPILYFSINPYFKKQIMNIGGAILSDNELQVLTSTDQTSPEVEYYNLEDVRILGKHSIQNIMAALLAARQHGGKPEAIKKVIGSFKGMPHRLEYVRRVGGVKFFNDSKSTNIKSVCAALEALPRNIILIMGGKTGVDVDYSVLRDLISKKVKILILTGESKEVVNRNLGGCCETLLIGTFDEGVYMAYQKSNIGDTVLLSPGCASVDTFHNYIERGNHFKRLVNSFE